MPNPRDSSHSLLNPSAFVFKPGKSYAPMSVTRDDEGTPTDGSCNNGPPLGFEALSINTRPLSDIAFDYGGLESRPGNERPSPMYNFLNPAHSSLVLNTAAYILLPSILLYRERASRWSLSILNRSPLSRAHCKRYNSHLFYFRTLVLLLLDQLLLSWKLVLTTMNL